MWRICVSVPVVASATDSLPPAYADRWPVETLFGGLKTRGFNFEDTRLRGASRLSKTIGLLALAFAWTDRIGEQIHDQDRLSP